MVDRYFAIALPIGGRPMKVQVAAIVVSFFSYHFNKNDTPRHVARTCASCFTQAM